MIGPCAPRTEFSTVMHSGGPCVSPLSVQPEMGCPPPENKPAHTDWDQTFCPLGGRCFPPLVLRGRVGA